MIFSEHTKHRAAFPTFSEVWEIDKNLSNMTIKPKLTVGLEPKDIILRDAMIQRFEYNTEAFWENLKAYLSIKHNPLSDIPIKFAQVRKNPKLYNKEISQKFYRCLIVVSLPNL